MKYSHTPVMLEEVLEGLRIKPGGTYVDCTLGGGGHSLEIARRLGPGGRLVALDRDPEAIEAGAERLAEYKEKVLLVQKSFSHLGEVLADFGIVGNGAGRSAKSAWPEHASHPHSCSERRTVRGAKFISAEYSSGECRGQECSSQGSSRCREGKGVDGVLFDLGVSSYQFDNPKRGFSYMHDAPLDMRMDPGLRVSAEDLVNKLAEDELASLIKTYGEERWAERIAKFICTEREKNRITTTGHLVEVIKKAIPAGARRKGPHPAKRTFQALRIAVNRELDELESALGQAVDVLKHGGRICVITFHSLEDRIVKDKFKELASSCICPAHQPVCTCNKKKEIEIITKKPLTPSKKEVEQNPRARSAKLRIAEKI